MKKTLKIFTLIFFVLSLSAALVACGESVSVPSELTLNEEYKLFWAGDSEARSYIVRLVGLDDGSSHEYVTMFMSYQLRNLSEGNYEVSVKAVSKVATKSDSGWSEPLRFYKEYETGCVYELINGNREYQVSSYGYASGEITIEDEYRGKPVTRIGDRAFRGSAKITKITLGKNIEYIGEYAFTNCSALEEVVFSGKVDNIGVGAFQQCRELTKIVLPEGVKKINDLTFAYCSRLGELVIPQSVKEIGESAFTGCIDLKTMTVPDGVTSLGASVFKGCSSLETVNVGKGVVTISDDAFYECTALKNVNFAPESELRTIGEYCFASCSALASVHLPDKLEVLGHYSFLQCVSLAEINIPSTVRKIGHYCFNSTIVFNDQVRNGDKPFIYVGDWVVSVRPTLRNDVFDEGGELVAAGLHSIDPASFDAGTKGIADRAFQQCFALESVSLPTSVKYVGRLAFGACPELWRFTMPTNGLEEIGELAFYNCKKLTSLNLREGLLSIGRQAFRDCTSLTRNSFDDSVSIPTTVTSIGQDAFYNTEIVNGDEADGVTNAIYFGRWVIGYVYDGENTEINLSSDTIGIADYAFNNFTDLSNVTGLPYARYIGKGAFWGCSSLGIVSFNVNLKEIRDYAFSQCSSLFEADLPRGLLNIGVGAFMDCTTLNEVSVPANVESIGDNAFMGCTNLKHAYFNDKLTSIGDRAFMNCITLEEIVIPENVVNIGERAFCNTFKAASLTLGESVKTIKKMAFAHSGIDGVSLPDSVREVGDGAFYACNNLSFIELGHGVEIIGDYAFAYPEVNVVDFGDDSRGDYVSVGEDEGGEQETDENVFTFENNVTVKSVILPTSLVSLGKYAFFGLDSLEYAFIPSQLQTMDICVFYECGNLTIYTDAPSLKEGWSIRFNPSFRPVEWGSQAPDAEQAPKPDET